LLYRIMRPMLKLFVSAFLDGLAIVVTRLIIAWITKYVEFMANVSISQKKIHQTIEDTFVFAKMDGKELTVMNMTNVIISHVKTTVYVSLMKILETQRVIVFLVIMEIDANTQILAKIILANTMEHAFLIMKILLITLVNASLDMKVFIVK